MHKAAACGRLVNFYAMKRVIWRITGLFLVLGTLAALLYGSATLLLEADSAIPALFRPAAGKRLLIRMEGYRFAQTEDGRVSWRMSARNADLYENKEAQLKDVEIVFLAPDGKTAALIGDLGTMDTVSGNASIRKGARDVRIVTSEGYLMTTTSLFWKAGERAVRTSDPFKVVGKEIYFEGTGLIADVDMQRVAVGSNVKAVLQE